MGHVFVSRFSPDVLNDPCMTQIVHMLIVMVCNNEYIGNPYLTAKLVEVVFVMNPSVQRRTGTLNEQFLLHPLALKHLVPALMNFYTGRNWLKKWQNIFIMHQARICNKTFYLRLKLELFFFIFLHFDLF